MSLMKDLIKLSVDSRNSQTLNQALTIVFPDKMKDKEFIIHEYDGSIPRLFGKEDTIELMLPNDMDEIVENAVVDAIANGTLFDDADHVHNATDYIAMTTLPVRGMNNKGISEPKALKYTIGSVVGSMDHNGRFGTDENDLRNGINFTHDMIQHGNEDNVHELVGSYLDAKDSGRLPILFKKSTRGIDDEIDAVKSVTPEDTITQSDIMNGFETLSKNEIEDLEDDVETKKECGTVCGIDEDDDFTSTGEMQGGEDVNTPTDVTEYAVYNDYLTEGFLRRPKKLKPIKRDVVAYIAVEINAIKDANDQAMLAGYTCSKLELVEFYITCIDTKDDRYIVPHTRQYLVDMQNELNRLLTRILQLKPINRNDTRWKAILPDGGVF